MPNLSSAWFLLATQVIPVIFPSSSSSKQHSSLAISSSAKTQTPRAQTTPAGTSVSVSMSRMSGSVVEATWKRPLLLDDCVFRVVVVVIVVDAQGMDLVNDIFDVDVGVRNGNPGASKQYE